MKEQLRRVLREKTTWLGLATIVIVTLGLDSFSAEQIAGLIAGAVAIIYPESKS